MLLFSVLHDMWMFVVSVLHDMSMFVVSVLGVLGTPSMRYECHLD
jgi:hypothetical protein